MARAEPSRRLDPSSPGAKGEMAADLPPPQRHQWAALPCSVGRFLAILNGAATDEARDSITPEDSSAFVERWGVWADALGDALVDPGSPLYRKIRLTAGSAEPFLDSKIAYDLVDAASHEQAVEMFATHPHLDLMPGNSIEIIECPALVTES